VLRAPFTFGNDSAAATLAWARTVKSFGAQSVITASGLTVSGDEVVRLAGYLETMNHDVSAASSRGQTLEQIQASVTLDAFRDAPFYQARRDQVAAFYGRIHRITTEIVAAAATAVLTSRTNYCDGYSSCSPAHMTFGGAGGFRASSGSVGVQFEIMLNTQAQSMRMTEQSEETFNHRTAGGSLLFRYALPQRRTPFAAVFAGPTVMIGDSKGVVINHNAVGSSSSVGFGGFGGRHAFNVHRKSTAFTVGTDMAMGSWRGGLVFIPVRLTLSGASPTALTVPDYYAQRAAAGAWPGGKTLMAGFGLVIKASGQPSE
jgi:hypothetical protein